MSDKYAVFNLECFTDVTRPHDPEDRWSGEDTCSDWIIPDSFKLGKNQYKAVPLTFNPVRGQDYFIVYYIWSTGDSFGHSERYGCEVHGVYQTFDEAEAERERLSKVSNYSVPWNGYFESLDTLEVKKVMCL